MFIYIIHNTINNYVYIGKTIRSIDSRLYQHKYSAFKRNSQTYLHRAIRKYGIENFKIEILESVSNASLLNEREIYWIEKLSPKYNMTKGGDGGDVSSSPNYIESIKNRVRILSEEYIINCKNFKHTQESKDKIRIAHKGKNKPSISEEHKNKIRQGNLGRKRPPRSDEWKEKQKNAQKGKKRKPFTEEHIKNLKIARQKRISNS